MTLQELEKIIDRRIQKASEITLDELVIKQEVKKSQQRLELLIKEYKEELSVFEINMLKTLNQHCLLLDLRETIELDFVFIEAYNIDNECILHKKVDF